MPISPSILVEISNKLLTLKNTSNSAFNLTGYSGSGQMRKSTSIGSTTIAAGTFTVGITSALDGTLQISMGSTDTRNLAEGRYMYDVLVSSGTGTQLTITWLMEMCMYIRVFPPLHKYLKSSE